MQKNFPLPIFRQFWQKHSRIGGVGDKFDKVNVSCKKVAKNTDTMARNDRKKFDKPKSKLFTPDPYYIPGYCGYCPMQKYQLGETYGKTTAKILTDDTVSTNLEIGI